MPRHRVEDKWESKTKSRVRFSLLCFAAEQAASICSFASSTPLDISLFRERTETIASWAWQREAAAAAAAPAAEACIVI